MCWSSNLKLKYRNHFYLMFLTDPSIIDSFACLFKNMLNFRTPLSHSLAVGPTAKCQLISILFFFPNRSLMLFRPAIYPTKKSTFSNFPSSWGGNVTHGKLHVRSLLEGSRKMWFPDVRAPFFLLFGTQMEGLELQKHLNLREKVHENHGVSTLLSLNHRIYAINNHLLPRFLLHEKKNANKQKIKKKNKLKKNFKIFKFV